MKILKNAAAALTAIAMIASASASSLPVNSNLSVPGISAEEATGYSISLSEEVYNINTLRTLEYYMQNELYYTDVVNDKVDGGTLDSRNAAEVKLSFDENIGFWGATLILDYDEELTFAGCSKYMEKENTPVSGFETMGDKYIKINAQRGRIIINFKTGKNVEETGELFKLLFVLPENQETGREYKVALNDAKTSAQIVPWDNFETDYSSKPGYILLTDGEVPEEPVTTTEAVTEVTTEITTTEATTTEVTTEATTTAVTTSVTEPAVTTPAETSPVPAADPVDIIMNADKDKLLIPSSGEFVYLEENAKINIEIPEVTAFRDDLKQVEFQVNLSDFDYSKSAFNTAVFGFNLPEGFSIAEVKPAAAASVRILDSTDPLIADDVKYAVSAGLSEKSQYIYFSAVDTSELDSNSELFSFVLNVPETGVEFVNDISVVSFYGRITGVDTESDGTVRPRVSPISNGESLFAKTETVLLTGFRGDVDLDNEVGQADANVVLKEVLASDAGKTILPESINMEAAGDYSVMLSNFLGDVDVSDNGTMIRQGDANCILKAVLYKDATPDRKMSAEVWEKAIG